MGSTSSNQFCFIPLQLMAAMSCWGASLLGKKAPETHDEAPATSSGQEARACHPTPGVAKQRFTPQSRADAKPATRLLACRKKVLEE